MKIYLAKPISGYSYEQIVNYYIQTSDILKSCGYDVLYPMIGKSYLRNEMKFKAEGYDNPVSTNHAITERDRWMVSISDIMYADLTESKFASIGCIAELAWGHDKGKHTLVSMEKDNIHRHAFILEMADIIFETHAESMEYLQTLGNRKIEIDRLNL